MRSRLAATKEPAGGVLNQEQQMQMFNQQQQQKRSEVQQHYILIRGTHSTEESHDRAEIVKGEDAERMSVILFEQRRARDDAREAQVAAAHLLKEQGMIPFKTDSMLTEEADRRAKRMVLEEKCRRSIHLLLKAERRDVSLIESLRKVLKAEDAKRYCIERNEEKETLAFGTVFKKTPWKPTLWMLGDCPFTDKRDCPFQNGLCHGLNVPAEHYAGEELELKKDHKDLDCLECGITELSAARVKM